MLSLDRIDVVLADFQTRRWLSSSSRSTAKESGARRSSTRPLKSGRRFEFRAGADVRRAVRGRQDVAERQRGEDGDAHVAVQQAPLHGPPVERDDRDVRAEERVDARGRADDAPIGVEDRARQSPGDDARLHDQRRAPAAVRYFQGDAEDERHEAVRRPARTSTAGSGRPDQTLKCSRSTTSTSIRPILGRIDCSRRALEARPRRLVRTVRLRI